MKYIKYLLISLIFIISTYCFMYNSSVGVKTDNSFLLLLISGATILTIIKWLISRTNKIFSMFVIVFGVSLFLYVSFAKDIKFSTWNLGVLSISLMFISVSNIVKNRQNK